MTGVRRPAKKAPARRVRSPGTATKPADDGTTPAEPATPARRRAAARPAAAARSNSGPGGPAGGTTIAVRLFDADRTDTVLELRARPPATDQCPPAPVDRRRRTARQRVRPTRSPSGWSSTRHADEPRASPRRSTCRVHGSYFHVRLATEADQRAEREPALARPCRGRQRRAVQPRRPHPVPGRPR